MIEKASQETPASVAGQDTGCLMGQFETHQPAAMHNAGAPAFRCGALQEPGVDDAMHLFQGHAGYAGGFVGGVGRGACAHILSLVPERI